MRVIVPDTGGGFGQKMHVMPEDIAVVALARAAARPVKWSETRRENFQAASHAREGRLELEAAADANGVLLGLRARLLSDAGAYHIYPLTQALEPLGACAILPGPYRTPAYAYECVAVATNKPPLGAYRGVGMAFAAFAMERTVDLLADRLGVDPAEIRRRNLIPRDGYPFASAGGFVYDSGDLPTVLEQALELAGYERLKQERDAARGHGRLLGVGLACYTEYTGMGSETYRRRGMVEVPGPEAARVEMRADASVACFVSFPSQGQGHRTTIAQLVADQLGVPPDRVDVRAVDTRISPPGTGTFASRGAIAQGGTVQRAAATVRAKILALAAGVLEAHAADLELRDGGVTVRGVPERSVPVTELARLAHAPPEGGLPGGLEPGLEATQDFDSPGAAFSGAVHVAAVEVDAETGRVSVRGYTVVEDCGPMINPIDRGGPDPRCRGAGHRRGAGRAARLRRDGPAHDGHAHGLSAARGQRAAVLRDRASRDALAPHARRREGHGRGRHRRCARRHRQRRRRRSPAARCVGHQPSHSTGGPQPASGDALERGLGRARRAETSRGETGPPCRLRLART